MKVKIKDVSFDTDGDMDLAKELREEWIGEIFEVEYEDEIADYISDESGFCIFNVDYEIYGMM
jgi:hypothetical protein